jgi:hypothetical protein
VGHSYIKVAGGRVAIDTLGFRSAQEPRLRFDKVAIGLLRRLQGSLSGSVPDGRTVIVTITAPVRQDSRTAASLTDGIRELLATGRTRLKATIHGNRVQVRVLKGGAVRTSRLIGFVHNPEPGPAVLFSVTRSLLRCMGSGKRPAGSRWLVISNEHGLAPVETVRQVCSALHARSVYKRIIFKGRESVRALRA